MNATLGKVYTAIYTFGMTKTYHAKLFTNGGSQAVRLPKECRFEGQEVLARREGRQVILEPIDEWSSDFLACLGSWDEAIERPPKPMLGELRDPFDLDEP